MIIFIIPNLFKNKNMKISKTPINKKFPPPHNLYFYFISIPPKPNKITQSTQNPNPSPSQPPPHLSTRP